MKLSLYNESMSSPVTRWKTQICLDDFDVSATSSWTSRLERTTDFAGLMSLDSAVKSISMRKSMATGMNKLEVLRFDVSDG